MARIVFLKEVIIRDSGQGVRIGQKPWNPNPFRPAKTFSPRLFRLG